MVTLKAWGLVLVFVFALSPVALVKPASAQSTPTPAVPAFTVQLVGPPTVVNTTYSLNSNTGQIVAKIGYTNQYSAVNVTIKNQVFSNLGTNTVYYNIRVKLDNSTEWSELFNANDPVFPKQSNSEYTVIPLGINNPVYTEYYVYPQIPVGAKVDIQVQAMIGTVGPTPSLGDMPSEVDEFYGNTGSWSSTQTVNVPANVPLSPTPAPSSSTSTPTSPTSTSISSSSYSSLLLITTIALVTIAFLLAVIVVLLLLMRKRKTAPTYATSQSSDKRETSLKLLHAFFWRSSRRDNALIGYLALSFADLYDSWNLWKPT